MDNVLPGSQPGDIVSNKDCINLFNHPSGYLRFSTTPIHMGNTLYPSVPEVNIGSDVGGITVSLHRECTVSDNAIRDVQLLREQPDKCVCVCHVVQVYLTKSNSYLTSSSSESVYILKESDDFNPDSLYIIMSIDRSTEKSFITLQHLSTGATINFQLSASQYSSQPNKSLIYRNFHLELCNTDLLTKGQTFRLHKVEMYTLTRWFEINSTVLLTTKLLQFDNPTKFVDSIPLVVDALKHASIQDKVKYSSLEVILENLFEIAFRLEDSLEANKHVASFSQVCLQINRLYRNFRAQQLDSSIQKLIFKLVCRDNKTILIAHTDSKGGLISPLQDLIYNNMRFISKVTPDNIDAILDIFGALRDAPEERRACMEVLRALCICNDKNLTDNQKFITERLFSKDEKYTLKTLKHEIRPDNEVYFASIKLKDIDSHHELQCDVITDLALYEALLSGTPNNKREAYAALVQTRKMFTLNECVKVITEYDQVDREIVGWYVSILISTYLDDGLEHSMIIPNMLSYQYSDDGFTEDERKHRLEKVENDDYDQSLKTTPEQQVLAKLSRFLIRYLKDNTSSVAKDMDKANIFKYHMMRLVQYLLRTRKAYNNAAFFQPLLEVIDGSNDTFYPSDNMESTEAYRKYYRFHDINNVNEQTFRIKERALMALYHILESDLYEFWERVMKHIYITIYNYDSNKDNWLEKIVGFLGPTSLMGTTYQIMVDIFNTCSPDNNAVTKLEPLYKDGLLDLLISKVPPCFKKGDAKNVTRVLVDSINYHNLKISELSLKILILYRCPVSRLLDLMPKVRE